MIFYGTARRWYLNMRGFFRYRSKNDEYRNLNILSCSETIDAVKNGKSLVRFGDGEMAVMLGRSIWFQSHDEKLGKELTNILKNDDDSILVAVPTAIINTKIYRRKSRMFWYREMLGTRSEWKKRLCKKSTYGAPEVTRARTDLKSKYQQEIFNKWHEVFNGRDIVIIEGGVTRMGVGNDLFDGAKTIRRIIAPSKNAYKKIDAIKKTFMDKKIKKDTLVLICLGPAAKQLTVDLHKKGYQAVDAGHLGQEYAFYCNNSYRTGEDDKRFDSITDDKYQKQIIAEIK